MGTEGFEVLLGRSRRMPTDSASEQDPADEFVEIDPSRRYGRYKEVLGKGAFKKVYRAFDELEGIEVAWNQVKVADLLRNSEDLERLYSEVHLLKTLKHKNIMKFYNSWVDTEHEHINFITEIFTSGTLRQYRKKHKHVDLRALKKWSRQILEGLLYLHSHDPPVIHRDLKCDNIFVNGNQGEIKIGDLGLAAILRKAHSAHSVIGTPEFMAPELYEEEYNELVDIYAFGMCLLELVTFEYPYVECINAAQIFKKVTSGIKPASLGKVKDPGVKEFIEKCIAKVSERLSAKDLLMDPFLHSDDENYIDRSLPFNAQYIESGHCQTPKEGEAETSKGFTVEGQRKDENTIFLKLRIADFTGHVRNIHFPFDVEVDTAVDVASEMVEELDLSNQDVSTIAEIIDLEIRSHIPDWEPRVKSVHHVGEVAASVGSASSLKDNASPSTNDTPSSHGSLTLERTHSGRKYWSDFPKAAGGISPGKSVLSNVSSEAGPSTPRESGVEYNEHSLDSQSDNTSPIREAGDGTVGDADSTIEKKETIGLEGKQLGDTSTAATDTHFHSGIHLSDDNKSLPDVDSEDVKIISEELEHLLREQKKEIDELKRRHELAISVVMKKISPDIRQKVFNICNLRVRGTAKPNNSSDQAH